MLVSSASIADSYRWKVIRVIDGDTLEVESSFLPKELGNLKVRVKSIDTPEKYPRSECEAEHKKALRATAYTKQFVTEAGSYLTFYNLQWDKYGGRVLADVQYKEQDLAASLIQKKLARPYQGEKKTSWCY